MEQIGGKHYESMAIQPWEIIEKNGLDFWEGNVVKYVLRYKDKNGAEDLRKALHYLTYLIDRESHKEPTDAGECPHKTADQSMGLHSLGECRDWYSHIGAVPAALGVQEEEDF